MPTPNFTGIEAVFAGIAPTISRGIDPANPATYNEGFARFIAAINSSENLKQEVALFSTTAGSTTGGIFVSGGSSNSIRFNPNNKTAVSNLKCNAVPRLVD